MRLSPPTEKLSKSTNLIDMKTNANLFLKAFEIDGYAFGTIQFYRIYLGRLLEKFDDPNIVSSTKFLEIHNNLKFQCDVKNLNPRDLKMYRVSKKLLLFLETNEELPKPIPPSPTRPVDILLSEYADYLRECCGVCEVTITTRIRVARQFLSFVYKDTFSSVCSLHFQNIISFLNYNVNGPKGTKGSSVPSGVRAFLKFLFVSRYVEKDFATMIPPIRVRDKNPEPKYLPWTKVEQLINSIPLQSTKNLRDNAMITTMAYLGLRSHEVLAIKLRDIDWRQSQILIHGKGNVRTILPLPQEAGKAIVRYLKGGRKGHSRSLFTSSLAPHHALIETKTIREVLHKAYDATGITPPRNCRGAHMLRHSYAMWLISEQTPMNTISDLLRHRDLDTTMIYAKHDLAALRTIAPSWPI